MNKFLKFILALVLFPITCLVVWEDLHILLRVVENFRAAVCFVLGAMMYTLIHYKFYNFSRMYVFIHETTHAVAALLCGIRVKDMSVKQESGFVKMNRTNAFVVLAPYFVPGYVIVTALLYILLDFFIDLTPYRQIVLFWVGFWMAFHFIQTFHTLWETDQPDLTMAGGKFFSFVIIVLTNMVVLALVLKILFPQDVFLLESLRRVAIQTVKDGQIIVDYIRTRIQKL